MLENFYGFKADPFRLTPEASKCFSHRNFSKARDYVRSALLRREGLAMITGDPGLGKTTLINNLRAGFSASDMDVALPLSVRVDGLDLLRMIASAFRIEPEPASKSEALTRLADVWGSRVAAGRQQVLIVDEAQDLSPGALEELRLLTNLQQDGAQLLQILLVGQESLRDMVRSPKMRQVHQRIAAAWRLLPLSPTETIGYVRYRLEAAGWDGDPAFAPGTLREVFEYSQGVPRLINLMCGRLLLRGATAERHLFQPADAELVARELREEGLSPTTTALFFDDDDTDDSILVDLMPGGGASGEVEEHRAPALSALSSGGDVGARWGSVDQGLFAESEHWRDDPGVMSGRDQGARSEARSSDSKRSLSSSVLAEPFSEPDEGREDAGARRRSGGKGGAEDTKPLPATEPSRAASGAAERAGFGGDLSAEPALNAGAAFGLRNLLGEGRWKFFLIGGLIAAAAITEFTVAYHAILAKKQVAVTQASPERPRAASSTKGDEGAGAESSIDAGASPDLPEDSASPASPMSQQEQGSEPAAQAMSESTASPASAASESSGMGESPQTEPEPIAPELSSIDGSSTLVSGSGQESVMSAPGKVAETVTSEVTDALTAPAESVARAQGDQGLLPSQVVSAGAADSSVVDEPAAEPSDPPPGARGVPGSLSPSMEQAASVPDGDASNDELMMVNVLFGFDSVRVGRTAAAALDEVATLMASSDQAVVKIVGFADHHGDPRYNLVLSRRRAESVARYLETRGVSKERFTLDGRGTAEQPVAGDGAALSASEQRLVRVRVLRHGVDR